MTTNSTIALLIVEDDLEIRNALMEYFLRDHEAFSYVASFDSVEALLASDINANQHICLLDIQLPGMSGIEGIFHMKNRWPELEILMLSVQNDEDHILRSICAGAAGYIEKGTSLAEIRDSVITLSKGGSPLTPSVARKIISYFQPVKKWPEQLSQREEEVVRGLVDGLSYKLIASRMDVSIDTVRKYIRRIYAKLQINSKGELIAKYHQQGKVR